MTVTDWFYPASATNHTGIGGNSWYDAENAAGSDLGTFAYFVGKSSSTYSYWLWCLFNFSIPEGSVIDGVEVQVYRNGSSAASCYDNGLRLITDGAVAGDDKKATETQYPSTAAWSSSYGGEADDWNAGWTAALVNAGVCGVALSVYAQKNYTAHVGAVRARIYYAEAALFLPAWYVQQRRNRR